jgi:hypothetical protein
MTNSGSPLPEAVPTTGVPASLLGPPPHPGISGSTGSRPAPKVNRRRRGSGAPSIVADSTAGFVILTASTITLLQRLQLLQLFQLLDCFNAPA